MLRRDNSQGVGGESNFTIDELPTRLRKDRRMGTLALFAWCGKSRGAHRNLD
jgi:hypothetical protein